VVVTIFEVPIFHVSEEVNSLRDFGVGFFPGVPVYMKRVHQRGVKFSPILANRGNWRSLFEIWV